MWVSCKYIDKQGVGVAIDGRGLFTDGDDKIFCHSDQSDDLCEL